jgi:hypothetical protein
MSTPQLEQQLSQLEVFFKGDRHDWSLLLPLLESDSPRVKTITFNLLRACGQLPTDRPNDPPVCDHIDDYLRQYVPYDVFGRMHKIPRRTFGGYSGGFLIPSDSKSAIIWQGDGSIQRFDPFTGELIDSIAAYLLPKQYIYASACAIHPEGSYLYQAMSNHQLRVIDQQQREVVGYLEPYAPEPRPNQSKALTTLSCDRSGEILVGYLGQLATILVWDLASGNLRDRIDTRQNLSISKMCLTPNGRYLVLGTPTGFEVWDLKNRQLVQQLTGGYGITQPVLSPVGNSLITSSTGVMREYDLRTGEVLHESRFPRDLYADLPPYKEPSYLNPDYQPIVEAIAHDGKTLLVSGCLWDFRNQILRRRYVTDQGAASFSPNGQFFVTRKNSEYEIWGNNRRVPKFIELTPQESLNELFRLCLVLQWSSDRVQTRPMGATEEALIKQLMTNAARNGYQIRLEDIRDRVVEEHNWHYYYYTLGEKRDIPWRELDPQLADFTQFRAIPLGDPAHFPF